jgi:hypothetical protein
MGIRDDQTLQSFAAGKHVPATIYKMIFWQRFIPLVFLKMGPVSKTLMFISWLLR